MKSLLKIIFIGIIAGVTYKYLNEHGINIVQIGREAYEWAVRESGEIKKIADSGTSSFSENINVTRSADEGSTSGTSSYKANPPQEETSFLPEYGTNGTLQPSESTVISMNDSDAEEFPIPEKVFTGTEKFPELDKYASDSPAEAEASLQSLAAWLTRPASTDLEKCRLLFTWIAAHIAYDDNGFNTGNYSDVTAEVVLRYRVSVCQGYSNLFSALCNLAGLQNSVVTGYSKGITYRPGDVISGTNHAWNSVKIDGRWRLFDVTWAAGYGQGVNGILVSVMKFDDYWFDTRPDEFIFSHLPEDEQWQLNDTKISKSQFERLPYVSSSFFKMGFNGSSCFLSALNGEINELPEAYMVKGDIRMVSMPYDKKLRPDKVIKVRIKSDNAVKIAYRNKGMISNMTREGNEFSAVIRTIPGPFCLMANFGGDGSTYETFLEYEVE
jgi:transglutaminase-like putative cysteine protease